jgi:hypothetical protein
MAAVASPSGGTSASSAALSPLKMEQLVAALQDPETRENALLDISKRRDAFVDLAPVLWHSYGVIPALLQEIVSIYPLLSPPSLSALPSPSPPCPRAHRPSVQAPPPACACPHTRTASPRTFPGTMTSSQSLSIRCAASSPSPRTNTPSRSPLLALPRRLLAPSGIRATGRRTKVVNLFTVHCPGGAAESARARARARERERERESDRQRSRGSGRRHECARG